MLTAESQVWTCSRKCHHGAVGGEPPNWNGEAGAGGDGAALTEQGGDAERGLPYAALPASAFAAAALAQI